MTEQNQPPRRQEPPGNTADMTPAPRNSMADYRGRELLFHKRALITGGDSGIGRAFAKEGADVAIAYLSEHDDAKHTAQLVQDQGRRCVAPGPVWTPLIPATLPAEKVATFGEQTPYGRVAQPDELAPSYVFFAAEQLSSYYTGEVLAALGGETTPG